MNNSIKSILIAGLVATSIHAVDHKSCIDGSGKSDRVKFIDNSSKKRSYTLFKFNDLKLFLARSNKAGINTSGEVFIKTSATTTASLGKVTQPCIIKPKVYAAL